MSRPRSGVSHSLSHAGHPRCQDFSRASPGAPGREETALPSEPLDPFFLGPPRPDLGVSHPGSRRIAPRSAGIPLTVLRGIPGSMGKEERLCAPFPTNSDCGNTSIRKTLWSLGGQILGPPARGSWGATGETARRVTCNRVLHVTRSNVGASRAPESARTTAGRAPDIPPARPTDC